MNIETTVKQSESELALKQFQEIKEKIFNLVKHIPNSEQDKTLLDKTNLIFNNEASATYTGYALFDYNYFEFTENYQHSILFNVATMTDNSYFFIHELAHLICIHYDISSKNHSGPHCLEFAIITYCIQWKAIYQHKNIHKSFFRAYDIHEDKAYSILSINICQFDSFIKNIQWTTFDTLVNEAKRLADIIRRKSIK